MSEECLRAAQELAPFFHECASASCPPEAIDDACNRFVAFLIENPSSNGARILEALDEFGKDPSSRVWQQYFANIRFLGIWGANATPVVQAESAWASAMCMTRIPKEFYEFVIPPWPAFLLRVPQDIGFVMNFDGTLCPMREVRVAKTRAVTGGGEVWPHWVVAVLGPGGLRQRTLLIRTDDLCGNHEEDVEDDAEARTSRMLFPLIGAVCMAFNGGGMARRVADKARKGRRAHRFPQRNEYVVGSPVKVDLRMKVKAFIEGGPNAVRGPMTIQTMVRGHWKNQPHGPQRSLRKFIHIEPHWKGPENAPIVVRPHVFTDTAPKEEVTP